MKALGYEIGVEFFEIMIDLGYEIGVEFFEKMIVLAALLLVLNFLKL